MQYSIINLSEAKKNSDFRIDAEYWKPEYINGSILIDKKENARLYELSEIKGGKRLPLGETFSNNGIPYIRAEDIKNNFVDYSGSPCISEKLHHILRNYQTKKDDVLLTIVGNSIGDIGIVKFNLDKCNLTENACKIINLDKITSDFLFIFMLSKFGQNYIEREKVGSAQPKLSLTRIKDFVIPIPSILFQSKIADLVNTSYSLRQSADKLYKEAENILLEELGLKDYKPQNKKCFTKNLADIQKAGRFDAEYFQPKYEDVENILKKHKIYSLNELCSEINYGTVPTSEYTNSNEGLPYIKGMNLQKLYISEEKLDKIINTSFLDEKFYTKNGDIIISQMGTVADVGIVSKKQENYIFASFTIRARLKNFEIFDPYYIGLYIQNVAKYYYFYKNIAQASVRQNTDLPTVKNLYIPYIERSVQSTISSKIQSSFSAREKSKQLLEVAKRAVEIAIEKDEENALKYIKENE